MMGTQTSGRSRAAGIAFVLALIPVCAGAASACRVGSDHPVSESGTSSVSTERSDESSGQMPVPHALLEAPGWSLRKAFDVQPGHVLPGMESVSPDWYAEYQQLEADSDGNVGHALRLSGIAVGLDAYRSSMEALGVSFDQVGTPAGPALAGTTAEAGARPVVIAMPIGAGTLELLSYDLSSDDLVALVTDIETVDTAAWQATGKREH